MIRFILNGQQIEITSSPNQRLIKVLRNKLNLCKTKFRCGNGRCGSCTVLLNQKPVPACIIPIYTVQDCEITTMEAFEKTPEYEDIKSAFEFTGAEPCGFCDSDKYLGISTFIDTNAYYFSSREDSKKLVQMLEEFYESTFCKCIEKNTFLKSIIIAAKKRQERLHGK